MKKICGMSVSVFVALVSSVVALLASVTTFFVIKEFNRMLDRIEELIGQLIQEEKKKKDDEELERYLDSSIQ